MRALSQRAHTTHELEEKLKKRPQYNLERGKTVLSRLQELGLLNDAGFLQRAVEDASQFRLEGPLKVAARLYKKGIPIEETKASWREQGISELEVAENALKRAAKRFQHSPKVSFKKPSRERPQKFSGEQLDRRKAQFLASRGFSPETIFKLAKIDGPL